MKKKNIKFWKERKRIIRFSKLPAWKMVIQLDKWRKELLAHDPEAFGGFKQEFF